MSNSTEVYCLNAYDNGGNFLCTLRCGQPSEIGQDYDYLVPNIGNREVEYICYTDKCGCACCLSNENEIIIHSTQGEIKTFTLSASKNCIGLKWSEIYGGNWCRTLVLYKTGSYPTSISDGTIAVEELTKNQYCTNTYWKTGLAYATTYYVKAFALDGSNNIIGSKCGTITTGTNFVTTCWGYTGAQQTVSLSAGTYKLEVWGASGGNRNGGKGGYSQGCLTLSQATTLYMYIGQCGTTGCTVGTFNGGGRGSCTSKGGSGGGGTDIRIGGNTLCHRRIVAGGGGGGDTGWVCYAGGVGGGCSGGNVINGKSNSAAGQGGTQTGGGSVLTSGDGRATAGVFGNGGYGCLSDSDSYAVVGGGGGRYGGGGGQANSGGGGSGYVYNASTCGNTPSGYNHNTQYYIINGYTCNGSCSFPTAAGGVETGHSGNGCIKISPV